MCFKIFSWSLTATTQSIPPTLFIALLWKFLKIAKLILHSRYY